MLSIKLIIRLMIWISLLSLSVSCTGVQPLAKDAALPCQHVSVTLDGSRLAQYAPAYILEESNKDFNLIGTPSARKNENGIPEVFIDPQLPTIYAMEQKVKIKGESFTNLIYRVHFQETPLYHLTAGKNVGLITIVTLNRDEQPVLITTVHTCGCYLGIIPTSHLPDKVYPENWPLDGQAVYGERLPSRLELKPSLEGQQQLVLQIRSETHRVMHLDMMPVNDSIPATNHVTAQLKPMSALTKLPLDDAVISFYETEGARKGYVRNSHKPLERLFMSWWSMDWRIGEDKDLGPKEQTGTTFYTSLKFWKQEKSDLWNFAEFLEYWGWNF
ncbi:MAG: hypothetical protein V2I50_13060 [Desulfuromusa sp.]|nr:hypothetical protein [Desulfuromusa sp.]